MSLEIGHGKEVGKEFAWDFLRNHSRFLLVGHEHPDGDDVGAICALHNVLISLGKEADMLLPDPVPQVYRLIQTSGQVMTELPKDRDYDAIVFTDLSNLERGGNFDFPQDIDSLSIDHHSSNERFTDYLYLRSHYAATCEMLAEMFFDEEISMDKDTCNALYMGIGTDSGFFKFSCTSPHTLLMASKLVAMGADPSYISNRLDEKSEEAMKCYQRVAGTVHSFLDGKIVIACMDEEAMKLDGENSDYYASIPRSIRGCEIAMLLKYRGEKETRVSFRSKEYANVGELAGEFGGGGHWKAAGCTIRDSFDRAEEILVKAAEKYL